MLETVSVPRRFLVEFLKALNFHNGHGTPTFDRVQAILMSEEVEHLLATPQTGRLVEPTHDEVVQATQLYRAEITKRMDTSHPSSSPSIESMTITLRDLFDKMRKRAARPDTVSLSGCPPRLHGSDGTLGSIGPLGLLIFSDPALPDDVMEFRDPITDRVLVKITNVGKA